MKIYIEFSDSKNPWGGGNQFLRNLKEYLIKKRSYAFNVKNADIILINSFENFRKVISLKMKFPNKIFVQRVNGITQLYNNIFDKRDLLTFFLNRKVSVGTIFQSKWCKKFNEKYGLQNKKAETIILNTPNEKFFYPNPNKYKYKYKIISSGWSSNWNKGFEILTWLDNNINFKKFTYTYIGKTPVQFKNIKVMDPLNSKKLSDKLRDHTIYISASKNDACSNSIVEAKACGLQVLALNCGGNPELLKKQFLYSNRHELLKKINMVANKKQTSHSIDYQSSKKYYEFFKKIHNVGMLPTRFTSIDFIEMYLISLYVMSFSFINKIFFSIKNYLILKKLKFKYS